MHAASMGLREGGVLVFAVEVPVKRVQSVIVSNRDSCVLCGWPLTRALPAREAGTPLARWANIHRSHGRWWPPLTRVAHCRFALGI